MKLQILNLGAKLILINPAQVSYLKVSLMKKKSFRHITSSLDNPFPSTDTTTLSVRVKPCEVRSKL